MVLARKHDVSLEVCAAAESMEEWRRHLGRVFKASDYQKRFNS